MPLCGAMADMGSMVTWSHGPTPASTTGDDAVSARPMMCRQVPDRYAERQGGYTRVLKDGFRRGDNSEMAIIELV